MKKLFFLSIGLIGLLGVKAQEKSQAADIIFLKAKVQSLEVKEINKKNALKPQLGIRTSINYTSMIGDDVKDAEFKFGWAAGLYYEVPLTNFVSIQPEVQYTRVGAKFTALDPLEDQTITVDKERNYTLDYIQVPVLFKFYPIGTKTFNIELGPQFGFNVYSSITDRTKVANNADLFEKLEGPNNVQKINYGVVAGIGTKLSNHIDVGFRYQLGFNNVIKVDRGSYDVKNHGFSFGVGYTF